MVKNALIYSVLGVSRRIFMQRRGLLHYRGRALLQQLEQERFAFERPEPLGVINIENPRSVFTLFQKPDPALSRSIDEVTTANRFPFGMEFQVDLRTVRLASINPDCSQDGDGHSLQLEGAIFPCYQSSGYDEL